MKLVKLSLLATALVGIYGCDGDDGKDGVDGSNGSNGLNSLVTQTVLTVGNTSCPNGGLQVDSGLDDNSDGTLQAGEIDESQKICAQGQTTMTTSLNNPWFKAGQAEIAAAKTTWTEATAGLGKDQQAVKGSAKNVILFVGDGMGISTVTASRIFEGQQMGKLGEEHNLSFDHFPFAGLSKTYNVDAQTPDSAGTMTAMMSGVKTDVGVLGVDEDIERGECSTAKGNELVTALELAEIAGKATGIISTARITHATPAATYAKSADRNWEDNTNAGEGCEDIASQLVNFEKNLEARYDGLDVDGIEVVMGGGRRHFLPTDVTDVEGKIGKRSDNRNLVNEWKATYSDGNYVETQAEFDAVADNAEHVFALFNSSHMQYEADRADDVAGEPSISEMTEKAIKLLGNNDKGYFLMVESGRIDHAHHAGSAHGALHDTMAFSDAIAKAVEMNDMSETLIIVTADHGHVFTIAGYPKRGNPILGKVVSVGKSEPSLASDGMPYTTLGYTNGRGMMDLGTETNADASYNEAIAAGRHDLSDIDTTSAGFHQEALVPRSSETHSGEDVGIYAQGPAAFMVNGTMEQSMIFHIMDYAAGLVDGANAALGGN